MDESPYLQSIEVAPQRPVEHRVGLGEHIIRQRDASLPSNAIKVYQFLGGNAFGDMDQLSDKHKISLFDESRYETTTLEPMAMGSIEGPEKKQRILNQEDPLGGGDSLYDEKLLNEERDYESSEEDEISSSSGSDEECSESNTHQLRSQQLQISTSHPPIVGDSMVNLGENPALVGKKKRATHHRKPVNLLMSHG